MLRLPFRFIIIHNTKALSTHSDIKVHKFKVLFSHGPNIRLPRLSQLVEVLSKSPVNSWDSKTLPNTSLIRRRVHGEVSSQH
jgi:hypothetical protein